MGRALGLLTLGVPLRRGRTRGSDPPLDYLLRDQFLTDVPVTPLPPSGGVRTASPGPGTWTLTDPNGRIRLENGKLRVVGGDNALIGLQSPDVAHVPGRALVAHGASKRRLDLQWASVGQAQWSFSPQGTLGVIRDASLGVLDVYTADSVNGNRYALVRSELGRMFYVVDNKLVWVSAAKITTARPLSVQSLHSDADETCDYVRVVDLPAPWNTEYGLAAGTALGIVPLNTTRAHEPNCSIEFTVEVMPSSSHYALLFRQNANGDCWRLQIMVGGSINLQEHPSGGDIVTRVASGAIAAAGDRFWIACDGATISVFRNGTRIIHYTSATLAQDGTSCSHPSGSGCEISDLVAWKRDVDLDAAIAAGTVQFDDQFPTVPGTDAQPGPGKRIGADTRGLVSVEGGALKRTQAAASSWTDPRIVWADGAGNGLSRAPGRTLMAQFRSSSLAVGDMVGWRSSLSASIVHARYTASFGGNLYTYPYAQSIGAPYSPDTWYDVALVLRPEGCFHFVRGGPEYPQWTLFWLERQDSSPVLWPFWSFWAHTKTSQVRNVRVVDLPAPFDTQWGLAAARVEAPALGEAIIHEPDALVDLAWTTGTVADGAYVDLWVRRTGPGNGWKVVFDGYVGEIRLVEVVNGVETTRSTAAGIPFASHTTYQLRVRAWGSRITIWRDGTQHLDYASATFNQTATQAYLEYNALATDAIANFVAWPLRPAFPGGI